MDEATAIVLSNCNQYAELADEVTLQYYLEC
jgi:hypothetical protein